jgi:hypothetical protein
MTNGWIALHRKIYNSKDFNNQLETSIFIYLLSNASHKDCKVVYRKKKINLKRGQICIAIRDLANKFLISYSKTKTIINHLITTNNINQNIIKNLSIFSIVKYSKYQDQAEKKNQNIPNRTTTNIYNTISNNNDNNVNNMDNFKNKKIAIPCLQDLKTKIIKKPKKLNEWETMRQKLDAQNYEKWVLSKLNS